MPPLNGGGVHCMRSAAQRSRSAPAVASVLPPSAVQSLVVPVRQLCPAAGARRRSRSVPGLPRGRVSTASAGSASASPRALRRRRPSPFPEWDRRNLLDSDARAFGAVLREARLREEGLQEHLRQCLVEIQTLRNRVKERDAELAEKTATLKLYKRALMAARPFDVVPRSSLSPDAARSSQGDTGAHRSPSPRAVSIAQSGVSAAERRARYSECPDDSRFKGLRYSTDAAAAPAPPPIAASPVVRPP